MYKLFVKYLHIYKFEIVRFKNNKMVRIYLYYQIP